MKILQFELITLPNGNSLAWSTVISIKAEDQRPDYADKSRTIPPNVFIRTVMDCFVVDFSSYKEAQDFAIKLSQEIKEKRQSYIQFLNKNLQEPSL